MRFAPPLGAQSRRIAAGLLCLLAAVLFLVEPAVAAPVETDHVEAELVSEVTAIRPGEPFWIALRLKMEENWHVYWRNPGDAGLPPTVEWTLPEGFTVGEFEWPYPHRIELPEVVDYGYDGEVFLLAEVTPPADLKPGQAITIAGSAFWLVCENVCIPGDAELELSLPVAAGTSSPDSKWKAAFDKTRTKLPRALSEWSTGVTVEDDQFVLQVTAAGGPEKLPSGLSFFPQDPGIIENIAPQHVRVENNTATIGLTPSTILLQTPPRLRGILVADGGWPTQGGTAPALIVDAPILGEVDVAVGASNPASGPASPAVGVSNDLSLPVAVAFAFLGGALLNLMPCVFPVLGIKVLGFVQQAGESPARARAHGFVFAAGVVVSFWILAGLLLALRAGGEQLGWGFQLQSPGFIVAMSFLLFAFALSLLGVFEIGTGVMGVAARAGGQGGSYGGSFASGALATAIATPCTAPYMGPALGYALTLSPAVAFTVFTALGAGMAFPYVVLSSAPALLKFLPKPGAWMETFKQLMAFPLFATIVWLAWVLGQQVGSDAVAALLGGLVLIGLGGWVIGRWGAPVSSARARTLARITATAAVVAACIIAFPRGGEAGGVDLQKPTQAGPQAGLIWEPFSAERVEALRAEGPVFVDFTAAWCLTCQVNEKVAFSSPDVIARFDELDVALVKADWTSRSPEITQALAAFGRNSVPLYVLYPAAGKGEATLLPEVLTRGIVLEALDNLNS